jgi:hypothetical protein
MTPELLFPLLGTIVGSGALTAGITALVNRRTNGLKVEAEVAKAKAEAEKAHADAERQEIDGAQVIATTSVAMLAPLRAEIHALALQVAALKKDLTESRDEVVLLTRYIDQLIGALRLAGAEIPPFPGGGVP